MKVKRFSGKRLALGGALGVVGLAGLGVMILGAVGSGSAARNSVGTASVIELNLEDFIEINPDYEEYLRDVEEGRGGDWVVIPVKYLPKKVENEDEDDNGLKDSFGDVTLPASYSLATGGYNTKVKNQGANGDCWAFATTTAMETFLKRKGTNYEFSPKQLDYLARQYTPYVEYATEAGIPWGSGWSLELGNGGNAPLASFILSGRRAPVSEQQFFNVLKANDSAMTSLSDWNQYNDLSVLNGIFGRSGLDGILRFTESESVDDYGAYQKELPEVSFTTDLEPQYLVTAYDGFVGGDDEISRIKQNVYQRGSVYVGTFWPNNETTSGRCWDAATKTIIDKGSATCRSVSGGHAMSIVGWDDNHAYCDMNGDTCSEDQMKHGAFQLQNSWGTGYDYDELVRDGLLNESGLSEATKTAIKDFFEDYDTTVTPWLAYSSVEGSTSIQFGMIAEMTEDDDYTNVYDVTEAKSITGIGETGNVSAVKYTFTTKDGEDEYIGAVAPGVFWPMLAYETKLVVYMDKNKTGNVDTYEKVGEVAVGSNGFGRGQIKLETPIKVKGDYDVVIKWQRASDGAQIVGMDQGDGIKQFFTTVYMVEEPEPTEYEIVEGNGQRYTGADSGMTFKINAERTLFNALYIDGSLVGADKYTVTSGSTVINIKAEYAKTLANGNHTIKVNFTDGKVAEGTFQVAITAEPGPDPGPTEYQITEGNGQKYTGGDSGMTFKVNASRTLFSALQIDGATVNSGKYTVSGETTVVNIKAEYAKTLANGNHTIKVVFTDGKVANGTFQVEIAAEPGPGPEPDPDPDPTEYEILEGNGQEYTGGETGMVFRIDADVSLFRELYIDDILVGADKYTVTSGSTIINIKADYAKILANGSHTIRAVFADGKTANGGFWTEIAQQVDPKPEPGPQPDPDEPEDLDVPATGDDRNTGGSNGGGNNNGDGGVRVPNTGDSTGDEIGSRIVGIAIAIGLGMVIVGVIVVTYRQRKRLLEEAELDEK